MAVPAALAHHGTAIYDNGKAVTVTRMPPSGPGASNPHCLLEFDVKDDKGGSVHWVAEECQQSSRYVSARLEPEDVQGG